MLYTIPDYYHEFVCTADKCEDTCCAGWQIAIDRKSLARYGNVKGDFRKRLKHSICWKNATFRQSEDKRCAFLNDRNLCDLYTALGKESLCTTCRRYPRHVEEFENVREITLSISCPEAAKILLSLEQPVKFLNYERPGEEEYEEFDYFLYSTLADAREVMVCILQNRKNPIEIRTGLVLALAHDLQVRINKGELFSCDEVLERYQGEKAKAFVQKRLNDTWMLSRKANVVEKDRKVAEALSKNYYLAWQMFADLYELEHLQDDWVSHLKETEYILFGKGIAEYTKIYQEFSMWLNVHMPQWEVQCEQLFVYFIYTYFCGAVYDGRAYAKVQMSVVSVLLVFEMLMAKWIKNEKILDFEDVTETVYRYSRELEHSDPNLEKMEKLMEAQLLPWFRN